MADILSIGSSGLSAYRKSLEVTGNNIVNANTDGYVRRSATLVGVGEGSSGPTTLKTTSGSGVNVDIIARASDTFVQSEMRAAQSNSAEATALADRLSRLEKSMFSGNGDISKLAQTFFSRTQDFATTPSSIPVRATVLQAASDLADGFRAQASTLSQEADGVITDAGDQLTQLNALAKQLADISKQLDGLGDSKGGSNDLLDQRDKIVDKIGQITKITVTSRASGGVNVYLGDSDGAPALVSQGGSKDVSVARIDGHIQFTLDPYGASTPLSPPSGGTLGGIVAYDDQLSMLTNQLDQLAVGFAKAVNDQHRKGVDMNGKTGGAIYSPNTFTVSPSTANKGDASATIDVSHVNEIGPGSYTAQFNASTGLWTVTSPNNNTQATGKSSVQIDGMSVHFSGSAIDRDTFTFAPLHNAAAGMHVLINDPSQLAASLPKFAQALTDNTGSASMTLASFGGQVAPPAVPPMQSIFNQALSPDAVVGVKNNGVIATVPAGANNVTLFSLAELASATFKVDLSPPNATVTGKASTDTSVIRSLDNGLLSLTVDGNSFTGLKLSPSQPAANPDNAQELADEFNKVFQATDYSAATNTTPAVKLSDKIFASVSSGAVTINGLDGVGVIKAKFTAAGQPDSIATTTEKTTAADIEILTREGIQLAGSPADPSILADASGNAINGFTPGVSISQSTVPYRNITIATLTKPINTQINTDNSATVTVSAVPGTDSPWQSASGTPQAGAVYSLAVDGLPKLRLAGREIAGKNSDDIAAALADKIAALGPKRIITGSAVTLSDSDTTGSISFSMQVGSSAYKVDYQRASLADGTIAPNGMFTLHKVNADGTFGGDDGIKITPTYALGTPTSSASLTNAGTATASINASNADASLHGRYTAVFDDTANKWTLKDSFGAQVQPVSNSSKSVTLGATSINLYGAAITFSGTPKKGDSFTFNFPTQSVQVELPNTQSNAAISFSGDGASQLGLGTNQISQSLVAAGMPDQGATNPIILSMNVNGVRKDISVDLSQTSPNNISNGVSWKVNGNGKLVLSAAMSTPPLSFATATVDQRDHAATLGFIGTDLTVSTQPGGTLTIASSIPGKTGSWVDTSQSVSRIGQRMTLSSSVEGQGLPEDLIVALKGNSPKQVTATFPTPVTRTNPTLPDVEVEVGANNQVKIYAFKTDTNGLVVNDPTTGKPLRGALLATRSYVSGEPVSYMGATFTIDGNANPGDVFQITTDTNRDGDNRNALALAQLQNSDLLQKGSGSLADIYTATAGKVGSSSAAAQAAQTSAKAVSDNITASYNSSTGVSLDTEAADLIKMQQAYQACATIVSTARDLFNTILRAAGG